MNFQFRPSTQEQLLNWTSVRQGETKLGQKIQTEISKKTRFVLLGIEESIGPQTNFGLPGAENGFSSFIQRFVNLQSNDFLTGDEICLIGSIQQLKEFSTIENGKIALEELDDLVYKTLKNCIQNSIIPIVIGGGHNNAFPLIQAMHSIKNSKIDVINLDPHADCRALEGRHSGNPFSYAMKHKFLEKYAVLGLHMAYNSSFILDFLKYNNCTHTFFDLYLSDRTLVYKDLQREISTMQNPIGFEIDLDAIAHMPSSAFSPSGWTIDETRVYIQTCAKTENIAYLHLPEGAPNSLNEEKVVGKTLSYLVYDFIRIKLSN
jgi:formiminoglutamase